MSVGERTATLDTMARYCVSAIVRSKDGERAGNAMEAAVAGGFRLIEFTLNTPGALDMIRSFSARDDLLVGAGTVLTVEDASAAVAAGARFLVSPVMDPRVIEVAGNLGVVSVPGTYTPTEMMAAHRCGADLVKLFPGTADVPGRVSRILGPLPFLRLFPTSGVTLDNYQAVLAAGAFGVGFVASLFTPGDMEQKRWTAIRDRAASILAETPPRL